ncbi:MAG: hypothetical protein N3G22_05025 [Candidatus Micrarchaeota archaeon]|nr:hypothetical protein [Candidatus Micrarchaeota archaeon]
MDISKNAKNAIAIIAVAALVAVVYAIPFAINSAKPQVCTVEGVCQHEQFAERVVALAPIFLLLGIALGAAAHYAYSERQQKAQKPRNPEAALLLLDSEERKVAEKIIAEKGRALQSEISRLEGIGKVRAHRIISRMEKRGVVEVERQGKTNIVRFSKQAAELFKD